MTVLAIDPGPQESAFVRLEDCGRLLQFGKVDNDTVLDIIRRTTEPIVIEMIASYGMAVGAEVFETCVVIGKMIREAEHEAEARDATRVIERLYRRQVKLHLCGSSKAKDANVRQALIDRFGEGQGKGKAIGTKKQPGPLFGVKADCWQALAVAVTYADTIGALKQEASAIMRSALNPQSLVGGEAG